MGHRLFEILYGPNFKEQNPNYDENSNLHRIFTFRLIGTKNLSTKFLICIDLTGTVTNANQEMRQCMIADNKHITSSIGMYLAHIAVLKIRIARNHPYLTTVYVMQVSHYLAARVKDMLLTLFQIKKCLANACPKLFRITESHCTV